MLVCCFVFLCFARASKVVAPRPPAGSLPLFLPLLFLMSCYFFLLLPLRLFAYLVVAPFLATFHAAAYEISRIRSLVTPVPGSQDSVNALARSPPRILAACSRSHRSLLLLLLLLLQGSRKVGKTPLALIFFCLLRAMNGLRALPPPSLSPPTFLFPSCAHTVLALALAPFYRFFSTFVARTSGPRPGMLRASRRDRGYTLWKKTTHTHARAYDGSRMAAWMYACDRSLARALRPLAGRCCSSLGQERSGCC